MLGRRVLPQVDVEFRKSHNAKWAVAPSCRLNFGAFNLDNALMPPLPTHRVFSLTSLEEASYVDIF
jgi:hypothetical protein